MTEGQGSQGCWKAEDTWEKWEGGVGDVRFSSSSRRGFCLKSFEKLSTLRTKSAAHTEANSALHSRVRHSHDVITFQTRLFYFLLVASQRILPDKLYWSALSMSQVQFEPRALDHTSLSLIWSLSFQTISICAMSSQQFHAIRDECVVYTAALKTITTCLGRNLADSGHDRQFSRG